MASNRLKAMLVVLTLMHISRYAAGQAAVDGDDLMADTPISIVINDHLPSTDTISNTQATPQTETQVSSSVENIETFSSVGPMSSELWTISVSPTESESTIPVSSEANIFSSESMTTASSNTGFTQDPSHDSSIQPSATTVLVVPSGTSSLSDSEMLSESGSKSSTRTSSSFAQEMSRDWSTQSSATTVLVVPSDTSSLSDSETVSESDSNSSPSFTESQKMSSQYFSNLQQPSVPRATETSDYEMSTSSTSPQSFQQVSSQYFSDSRSSVSLSTETSDYQMSTRSISEPSSFDSSPLADIQPSASSSELMDSAVLSYSPTDSIFNQATPSFTAQSGEFASILVPESSSGISSGAVNTQQYSAATSPGAVSYTDSTLGAYSTGAIVSSLTTDTVIFSDMLSSVVDSADYRTSLETPQIEPTATSSIPVYMDTEISSFVTVTPSLPDNATVLSVMISDSIVTGVRTEISSLQMSTSDLFTTSSMSISVESLEASSSSFVVMTSAEDFEISGAAFSTDIPYGPATDISSTDTSSVFMIISSSSEDINSLSISTPEASSTAVTDSATIQVSKTLPDSQVTATEPRTTATAPATTETTLTATTPVDLEVVLVMDGDCEFILATSENKKMFIKELQVEISEELDTNENNVEVQEIECGSVNVSMTISNISDPEFEEKFLKAVKVGNISIILMNGTTPMEFTANSVITKVSQAKHYKPQERTKSDWDEEHMWLIIILVSSITVGMTILLVATLCFVNHRKKKYSQSFDLGITPASNVRLEDFTLTRMDRPHHVYSSDGQLVVKMPNGNQAGGHSNTPAVKGGKNQGVVRNYVHSNGHYALPIVDMESIDSNLMRAPSTEKLVAKHMMTSELPGIDNPSFSSDDILDSGNESDRISDAKQETPEVSPARITSPVNTSTPGGESRDIVDGGAATSPSAQANNEIAEASLNVSKVNEHDSSGDSACQLLPAGEISQTANVPSGSVTGVGALDFTIEQQRAMLADLPPPPNFTAPPIPPPPPAVSSASHRGSDTGSDSGAASARQSDIESPASSELGGTQLK